MIGRVLWAASIVLKCLYLALPPLSLGAFGLRGRAALKRQIAAAWIGGAIVAAAVLSAYVLGVGGSPSITQICLTLYLGAAIMLLLKSIDFAFRQLLAIVFRTRLIDPEKPVSRRRLALAGTTRVIVFACFALPWVMAAVMVYRPRVQTSDTPASVLQASYVDASLTTRDGVRIAAWYVPAERPSDTTVILLHGLGSNRTGMWTLMNRLHDVGVNTMAIDFRAHGASSGQLCTFGVLEREDVLAAIDWVSAHHAQDSRRLFLVGASLGGAAALGAAANDDRVSGVVTLATFDTLAQLSTDMSSAHLPRPIGWLTRAFGLPIASLHTGVDLVDYAPRDDIGKIWPRPVMVIHGAHDQIIPYEHGKRLYDAAFAPREGYFPAGSHDGVLEDKEVIDRVINFVASASSEPIV